ncbi:MAG: ABC transporter substrate-binding protein [Gammaproteobacteria bacterium]|nr:ABC transporter substrate-binding protein [Gammaproteobacteria bacterium]
MIKSTLLNALLLLLVLPVYQAYAQDHDVTIGISTWTGYPKSVEGFKKGLQAGGVNLSKVRFLERQSGIDKQKQQGIVKEFTDQQVDLVFSLTTSGTTICKAGLANNVPIVFSVVTYPADSGLIESFEYSANNLVGTSNFVPYHHYDGLLARFLPSVKTIAIFIRKGEPNSKLQAVEMRRLFRARSIKATIHGLVDVDAVKQRAQSLVGKVDVFMTTTDTLMQSGGEKALIEISKAHKIPILSSNKVGIEMGSTFGPVADFYTLGKMSGRMAAQILLKGKTPSELSSLLQDPPDYLVNRGALQHLGIEMPNNMTNIKIVD